MSSVVRIIGGGLAGCEAAWQVASAGVPVALHEMRPVVSTDVHTSDRLAELVCSNSLKSDSLDNASGILKEEMRHLGSLVLEAAEELAHRGLVTGLRPRALGCGSLPAGEPGGPSGQKGRREEDDGSRLRPRIGVSSSLPGALAETEAMPTLR